MAFRAVPVIDLAMEPLLKSNNLSHITAAITFMLLMTISMSKGGVLSELYQRVLFRRGERTISVV